MCIINHPEVVIPIVHGLGGFGDGQCSSKGYSRAKCEEIIGAAEKDILKVFVELWHCCWGMVTKWGM